MGYVTIVVYLDDFTAMAVEMIKAALYKKCRINNTAKL